jgi:hypothetical protein
MRTNMLVALGAAVTTIIAFGLYDALQAHHQDCRRPAARDRRHDRRGGLPRQCGLLPRQRSGTGADDRGQQLGLCGAVGDYVIASITYGAFAMIRDIKIGPAKLRA